MVDLTVHDHIDTEDGTLLQAEEGSFVFVTALDNQDMTTWLLVTWESGLDNPLKVKTFKQLLGPLRREWQQNYAHWQVRSNALGLVVDAEGYVKESA